MRSLFMAADTGALARDIARFYGVTIGIVTNNQDPKGQGRVRVQLPWLAANAETFWARVVTPMAGKDRGLYFLPEVNDEVLVAFEHGRLEFPYILGALWNGEDTPPATNNDGKNSMRLIKSRTGHTIQLDDSEEDAKIAIQDSSGKNRIVLSTQDNTLSITTDGDITIQSSNGKLTLQGKGIELRSDAEVKIEAHQNIDLKAGSQLNINGQMVNIN